MSDMLRKPWLEAQLLDLLARADTSRVPFKANGFLQTRVFHNYRYEKDSKAYNPEEMICADVSDKFCAIRCRFTQAAENKLLTEKGWRLTQLKGAILSKVRGFISLKEATRSQRLEVTLELHEFRPFGDFGGAIFGEPHWFNDSAKARQILNSHKILRLVRPMVISATDIRSQASQTSSDSDEGVTESTQVRTQVPMKPEVSKIRGHIAKKDRLITNADSPKVRQPRTKSTIEASSQVPMKRKRLHSGWGDFQDLTYYDCQIPGHQQNILDSEECWMPKGDYAIEPIRYKSRHPKAQADSKGGKQSRINFESASLSGRKSHSPGSRALPSAVAREDPTLSEAESEGPLSWPPSPELPTRVMNYDIATVRKQLVSNSPPIDSSPPQVFSPKFLRKADMPYIPPAIPELSARSRLQPEVEDFHEDSCSIGSVSELATASPRATEAPKMPSDIAPEGSGHNEANANGGIPVVQTTEERNESTLYSSVLDLDQLIQQACNPASGMEIVPSIAETENEPVLKVEQLSDKIMSSSTERLSVQNAFAVGRTPTPPDEDAVASPVAKSVADIGNQSPELFVSRDGRPEVAVAQGDTVEITEPQTPTEAHRSVCVKQHRTLPWPVQATPAGPRRVSPVNTRIAIDELCASKFRAVSSQHTDPYEIARRGTSSSPRGSSISRPWQMASPNQVTVFSSPGMPKSQGRHLRNLSTTSQKQISLASSIRVKNQVPIQSPAPHPYSIAARTPPRSVETSRIPQSVNHKSPSALHLSNEIVHETTQFVPEPSIPVLTAPIAESTPLEENVNDAQIPECGPDWPTLLPRGAALSNGTAPAFIQEHKRRVSKVLKFDEQLERLKKEDDGLDIQALIEQDRARFIRLRKAPPTSSPSQTAEQTITQHVLPPDLSSSPTELVPEVAVVISRKRKAEVMDSQPDTQLDSFTVQSVPFQSAAKQNGNRLEPTAKQNGHHSEKDEKDDEKVPWNRDPDTPWRKLLQTTFKVRNPTTSPYDVLSWRSRMNALDRRNRTAHGHLQ